MATNIFRFFCKPSLNQNGVKCLCVGQLKNNKPGINPGGKAPLRPPRGPKGGLAYASTIFPLLVRRKGLRQSRQAYCSVKTGDDLCMVWPKIWNTPVMLSCAC